jgi:hypothetical protein
MDLDTGKTLEELDGCDWGEPTYGSHLVTECHRLRRVPLRDFTVDDLCTMIGQDIGSEYLVPIAVAHLAADPLVDRDYYPGVLLENVVRLPKQFWVDHPDLHGEVAALVAAALDQLHDAVSPTADVRTHTQGALRRFLAEGPDGPMPRV